jgi:hypothetical protein
MLQLNKLYGQLKFETQHKFETQNRNANICIDNLGNIYVYTEKAIVKYNSLGKSLYSYSVTNATNITKIDVLNPLRILVFFKDINQVMFLDNTLSETGININLNSIDLQLSTLVCNSSSKGIWVYDSQNIEISHLSNTLETLSKTGNLAILLQQEIQPTNMFEFNNQLYLVNRKSILVFDIFGTFIKEIPFECGQCSITENAIYNCDTRLSEYNIKTKQIESDINMFDSILQETKNVTNGLYIYSINNAGTLIITKIIR